MEMESLINIDDSEATALLGVGTGMLSPSFPIPPYNGSRLNILV